MSTSCLVLLKMKGAILFLSDFNEDRKVSVSSTLSDNFFMLVANYALYLEVKTFSSSRKPGRRKSKMDHNSLTLFCKGVPVKINFFSHFNYFTVWVVLALEFLIMCPSSRMT